LPDSGTEAAATEDQGGADRDPAAAAAPPNRDGWGVIRRALRVERRGVVIGVVVGLCWTAAKVAVPALVQGTIDNGIVPADKAALLRWTVAIGVAAVLAAAFTGLRRYWAFKVSRSVETNLRQELFAHTQRLHFGFHDRVQTGDLMSRANTDLQQIQAFVVLIPLTISNFVTVVAVTVILVLIDPVLTVLALGSLPLLNYLGKRFSTRLHPAAMAIQRESAELASVVEETVSGVRVVKGFGAEAVQAQRLRREADDVYDASIDATEVRARFLPAMELLPNVGLILVLGYGGHQVLNGSLSVGALVAFTAYIVLLIWPLRMLGMIIAAGQRASASAHRAHEILSTDPVIVDPAHPRRLPADDHVARGEVVFDDVVFGYEVGRDVPVLDHLDLRVAPGESVALVGPTGSGKSTIARLLPRFYDVDTGSVTLDGVDVRELSLVELRASVGLVFEETFLFSDSIAANIAFAQPRASFADIQRAARLAGADTFVEALPDGYETLIGERGYSLSGGQRQRLAIARAIVADPRVLILDDATSAVDPTKEHEIRDALTEVMTGRTTLVIAHRPPTIALADRVVLMDAGRIVADGTHRELLAGSARYRAVLASAEARDREQHEEATLDVG
jgi:ATP-binding cassette subfamily B protein